MESRASSYVPGIIPASGTSTDDCMQLNPYPDFTDTQGEGKQVQRFIDAARATGTVEVLVLSTVALAGEHKKYLAEDPEYPQHPMYGYLASKVSAEDAVRTSGVKHWTIIRPGWLMQNYIHPYSTFHFPDLHASGRLATLLPLDKPIAHTAADDVGRFTAAAFLDPVKYDKVTVPLVTANVTLREAMREMEAVAGVKVAVEQLDPDTLDKTDFMTGMRMNVANFMKEKPQTVSQEDLALAKSFGLPLTSVREYFEKHKAQVVATLQAAK